MLFFLHFQVFLGGDGGSIFYLFILISDFKGTFEEEKSGELLVNSLEERMFCSTKVLLAMLKLYTYTQTMQNVYVVLFYFSSSLFFVFFCICIEFSLSRAIFVVYPTQFVGSGRIFHVSAGRLAHRLTAAALQDKCPDYRKDGFLGKLCM